MLQTVSKVRRQINPKLRVDGILLTMVDNRTNYAKEISALLRDTYGMTTLFNAPATVESFYSAEFNHFYLGTGAKE